jgi:hypothetical protein
MEINSLPINVRLMKTELIHRNQIIQHLINRQLS